MPNSQNWHHKNCIADSKENYSCDLGSERVYWHCKDERAEKHALLWHDTW